MLLQDHCEAVSNARTRDEFQQALVRFGHDLGFSTISATAIYDLPGGGNEGHWVDNTSPAYRHIFEDRTLGPADPVMQHCKHSQRPILWDQSTYVRAKQGNQWEIQAPYGYRTGIAMALHLPFGRHFVIGVDRDEDLPIHRPDQMARMVADFASLLIFAQENALCLLPPRHLNEERHTSLPIDFSSRINPFPLRVGMVQSVSNSKIKFRKPIH